MTQKVRASSLAGYTICDYRALLDLRAEKAPRIESPYAALGTITHHFAQRAVNAAIEMPPELTQDVWDAALTLFDGGTTALLQIVERNAQRIVEMLPPAAGTWRAEVELENEFCTGHIDLLSADGTEMCDIKTASRKPDFCRAKAEHVLQMCAYKILDPRIQRAHLLYVESLQGRWGLRCTIDMTGPEYRVLLNQLTRHMKYLNSTDLINAVPRLGPHCKSMFCPHQAVCSDRLIPPSGDLFETAPKTTVPKPFNPFA